jgi:carboxyvinyl-carboxyphosphonate phosphorylmutase
MNLSERRERFRSVLNGDQCFHPGSVFDPLSARIAQDLGYEFGMFAGSTASLVVLGAPDIVLLTLTEFAEQAYRISRACTLPLMVDADHGYGNAFNAARTVEELETAGVAGLTLEDTALPAGFGAVGSTSLISVAEGAGKLRAAVAARQDPSLAIIGRTSAVQVTNVDDAIARAKAYESAGVDAMFFAGVKNRAQLDAISAATTLPLILGYPGADLVDLGYLASRRVKICLQGHAPIMAGVQAIYDTLKAMKDGVPPAELKGIASNEMMKRLTRSEHYERSASDFLAPPTPKLNPTS